MKRSVHTFLCLTILSIGVTAQQTPFLQWEKTYGGSKNDYPFSIQQTMDSGYIVAGYSYSKNGDVTGNNGRLDYWILKLDAVGNIQWQKSYGGSLVDNAYSIQQTTDGGYVVAGYTYSSVGDVTGNHGNSDCWIIKLDAAGTLEWQKALGGSNYDYASSIQQTTDGGYVVAGYTDSNDGDVTGNHGNSDYWIVKLDAIGNIQWQKSYGGSLVDYANSIHQTTDNGYIVGGSTYSNDGDVTGNHGDLDYWIVKIDRTGNIQWQKALGGTNYEDVSSIQQTTDDGYIVAGNSKSNNGDVTGNYGDRDYWIVKLDDNGNIKWQKSLGGSSYDYANSIQQTTDGGYMAAGISNSTDGNVTGNHGSGDYWIVKLDDNGNIKWQKSLGGSNYDEAYSIQQTTDGGYMAAGISSSNDGNVTVSHGSNDYWIVKLSPEVLNDTIRIQPSPFHVVADCYAGNRIQCLLPDNSVQYTVKLYRFGVMYASAVNVVHRINFHHLPAGAYYATATNANGVTSCSSQLDIVPYSRNNSTTNITSTTAQLNWNSFDCVDVYKIQFRVSGESEWRDKQTTANVNSFILDNLLPSTTYEWRVASEKRVNGIKATGKYSYSITFTTASALVADNNVENLKAININSTHLSALPNPAKNSFKILFNTTTSNKVNAILYDVNGKAAWTSGLINANGLNGKQVNASQFAKGIFYLKIINEQGELIGSTKVIIAN